MRAQTARLLAYLGMSGGRTDIVAHFAGFGLGGLFGAFFGFLEYPLRRVRDLPDSWSEQRKFLGFER